MQQPAAKTCWGTWTKEQLVTDLDGHFEEELDRLIRTRQPETSPAAVIRERVLDAADGIRRYPAEQFD